jgi:hypothetical protein
MALMDGAPELTVLPGGVELEDLTVRVFRSSVCVYESGAERIRLLAVWRWSWLRRKLVAHSRRDPEWSPEWSRPLAERAWSAR